MDCKISKNNINYKIKKENVVNIIPTNKSLITPFNFTVPHGINVLKVKEKQNLSPWNWYNYIKVVQNRTYNFLGELIDYSTDEGNHETSYAIQDTVTSKAIIVHYYSSNDQGNITFNGGEITHPNYIGHLNTFNSDVPVYFEYSNEINKTTTIHADLT